MLLQISPLYIGFCFLTGPCFTDKECRHPSNAINYGYICVLFTVVHLRIYIGGSLYTGMQQLKENLFEVTLCLKSMLTTIKFSVFCGEKVGSLYYIHVGFPMCWKRRIFKGNAAPGKLSCKQVRMGRWSQCTLQYNFIDAGDLNM